ncbi:hypothetical protein [Pseudomonas fragi]|uniref:hypothetical protein n=1 Tax=Pseudomonas fragi TaxID=296 RepID=UPI00147552A8|nr:hypothetical protein [Pseudomonas fragi]NNB34016.1 hypothetical protein [Pseudomonas fragi]
MTTLTRNQPQQSVLAFKQMLKNRIGQFAVDPSILSELAHLRSVRRSKWDADLDYYGNRKHAAVYREMRAAKEAGKPVPRWNSPAADTSSYPLSARIKIERESYGNHMMHAQLRRSIALVLSYLVDKVDLVSGVCVSVKKKRYRELYIREIASGTGLGKRTVQRALSNLSRHRLINRGVALIAITPAFYKALGVYSSARAMASSLRALIQTSGYRGVKVNPETIVPHKSFHRFSTRSSARPSLRKLLASTALAVTAAMMSDMPKSKVPQWNNQADQDPPRQTGPPPQVESSTPPARGKVGAEALKKLKASLSK